MVCALSQCLDCTGCSLYCVHMQSGCLHFDHLWVFFFIGYWHKSCSGKKRFLPPQKGFTISCHLWQLGRFSPYWRKQTRAFWNAGKRTLTESAVTGNSGNPLALIWIMFCLLSEWRIFAATLFSRRSRHQDYPSHQLLRCLRHDTGDCENNQYKCHCISVRQCSKDLATGMWVSGLHWLVLGRTSSTFLHTRFQSSLDPRLLCRKSNGQCREDFARIPNSKRCVPVSLR